MAKKGGKSSGKVSLGGRQKNNLAHESKRQAYFAKKREEGRAYKYSPNTYKEGSEEWAEENYKRQQKAKSSKLPYARRESIFAKLDNYLNEQKLKAKDVDRKNRKVSNA